MKRSSTTRAALRTNSAASSTGDGAVEISVVGSSLVATLTRRNARNRISSAMGTALMELAEAVEDDDALRALAITGAGNLFCAGFDDDVDGRVVETLSAVAKPTVAIINGDAFDEGLELALALDLRITLSKARLALTQLQRGALPRFGGTQRLPRLIGPARALLMLLSGEPVNGNEAAKLGLATYLAPDRRQLDQVKRDLLTTIESRGPVGARLVKEAVKKGYDMTLEQGIRLEEDLYALLQTTTDRAEGVRAFLEKRKPLFKGV